MAYDVGRLADRALALRKAFPDLFDAFVKEFAIYADDVTVAVTEADASEIMTAKGRAQQMRSLLRLLAECHLRERLKPARPAI